MATFLQLPLAAKIGLAVLVIAAITIYNWSPVPNGGPTPTAETEAGGEVGTNVPPPAAAFPSGTRDVVFCVWNLENLFDDRDDHLKPPDEEYDAWFARDAAARTKKYHNLATALLKLNGGRGPDVIVGMELESLRSAVMLQDALNAAMKGGEPYRHVATKELANAGRHIAPGIVSRLLLERVRLHGHRQRILEAHVMANGHDLFVIAAHWTSHLTDDGHKKEGGRNGYATAISEIYQSAIEADPKVDFLVCGDFNDEPDSEAVARTLHMVSDSRQVTPTARPPRLFGLLSGRSADEYGTLYYKKPLIYDHIGVSPGMFDNRGWGYDPASVKVPTDGLIEPGAHGRRPWRFGSPKDLHARGYSDHFPVVVTLKVAP